MFLIFYILLLLAPLPIYADSGHVVISEIQTYGIGATDEFVRLYNSAGAAADISGWRLTKKTSSGSESNLVSSFADGTAIPAGAYFLITHKTDYKGGEMANATYSGASYSLADNNTVTLKSASGAVIDKVGIGQAADYEGAPAPNPEQGKSIKRYNNVDTDNNKNDFSAITETPPQNPPEQNISAPPANKSVPEENPPQPSFSHSAVSSWSNDKGGGDAPPTATTTPAASTPRNPGEAGHKIDLKKLSIIEVLPNPEGADADKEYIKIFYNGNADAELAGLYLDDEDGGSNPYKIPAGTIIKAEGELVFYREKTGLALNNDNDAARILDYSKKEIAAVEYEDAPEGNTYKLNAGKWRWMATTNGNSISDNNGYNYNYDKKQNSSGTKYIAAVVIAPPDTFNSQIMYVDGLQLYMYSKDWPQFNQGDKISAWGEPSTYFNEPRLKLKNKSAIKIISRGNTIEPIEAEGLSEDDLGRLIIIEGEVMEAGANKIILDANGEEISVYNKTGEKIFTNLKEKDVIQITGIVSRYKDDLRLLPRSADDIVIIKSNTAVPLEKNNNPWQYVISALVVSGIGAGIYIRRWKNGRQPQLE